LDDNSFGVNSFNLFINYCNTYTTYINILFINIDYKTVNNILQSESYINRIYNKDLGMYKRLLQGY